MFYVLSCLIFLACILYSTITNTNSPLLYVLAHHGWKNRGGTLFPLIWVEPGTTIFCRPERSLLLWSVIVTGFWSVVCTMCDYAWDQMMNQGIQKHGPIFFLRYHDLIWTTGTTLRGDLFFYYCPHKGTYKPGLSVHVLITGKVLVHRDSLILDWFLPSDPPRMIFQYCFCNKWLFS